MWLKLDLNGIDFHFRINGYTKSREEIWNDQWCGVDLTLESKKWLHYSISSEILLSCEVEEIRDVIFDFLQGKRTSSEKLTFIEPDLSFHIYPSGIKGDADTHLHVHLWDGGLTANYISICFDRYDLEKLCLYLQLITGKITKEHNAVHQLIESDVFRP